MLFCLNKDIRLSRLVAARGCVLVGLKIFDKRLLFRDRYLCKMKTDILRICSWLVFSGMWPVLSCVADKFMSSAILLTVVAR